MQEPQRPTPGTRAEKVLDRLIDQRGRWLPSADLRRDECGGPGAATSVKKLKALGWDITVMKDGIYTVYRLESEPEPEGANVFEELMSYPWEDHVVRRSTGLVEHVCPCGVGHPNPGSALYIAEELRLRSPEDTAQPLEELEAAWSTHGCCAHGCCAHPTFPDYRDALIKAHEIIRNQQDYVRDTATDLAELEEDRDMWRSTAAALTEEKPFTEELPVNVATFEIPRWWQFLRKRRLMSGLEVSPAIEQAIAEGEADLGEYDPDACPGGSLQAWLDDHTRKDEQP